MNLLQKIKSFQFSSNWFRIRRPPSYSVIKTLLILILISLLLSYTGALRVFDNLWFKHQALLFQHIANTQIIVIKIKPEQFKRWQTSDYQKIFTKLAALSPQAVLIDLPAIPHSAVPIGKIPNLYLSPTQIAKASDSKRMSERSNHEAVSVSRLFNYVGVLNTIKDNDGITRSFNAYPNTHIDLPYLPFLLWQQQTLSAQMPKIGSLKANLNDDFNQHLSKSTAPIQSLVEDVLEIADRKMGWKNNQFFFTPASTDFLELDVLGLFGDSSLNEIIKGRYILIGLDDSRPPHQEDATDSLARKIMVGQAQAANFEDYTDRHLLINQKNVSAVELHAHILHALLENQATWSIPYFWQISIAISFVILTLLAVYRFNPKKMFLLILLFMTLFIGLQATLFFLFQHWLAPSLTLFLLILIYPLHIEQRMRLFYKFMNHEIRRLKNNTQLSEIFTIKDLKSDNLDSRLEKTETGDTFEQHLNFFRGNIAKLEDLQRFVHDNLNALPDSIMVVDLRGIIKLMNRPAKNWWQSLHPKISSYYFFHDLLNLEKEGVLLSDSEINWLNLEKKCMDQHKETQDLQFKILRNNEIRYISLKITPSFNRHMQIISYLCVFHDYTNMELAEQARDETMRFLSHDMRSPQSSIIATLQMQKKQLPIPEREQVEFLDKIEYYAQKTLHLAEEFVQMSKAEGKNYHFEEINLYEVVISVIDDVWPLAQKKHIQIQQKLIEDAYVFADGELMARAIMNILSNAIKYSFEHRNIWVELTQKEDKSTQKMMVVCTITDEGPGISTANQQKLFARYERFTNTQKTEGVGLGLVFVKTVLDGHQGQIICQSKEGRGSAFKIYLPYLPEGH